jgi:hypothetical protein
MGTLSDIPSDLARWYARRLKYLWMTSVSEGLGFFLVYTLLVVIGGLQLHRSVYFRKDDEKRLDHFLQSDHQVRDADRYVSALSVVLSAVQPDQRIQRGECPPASRECERARNVINATVQFADLIVSGADQISSSNVESTKEPDVLDHASVTAILNRNGFRRGTDVAELAIKQGIEILRLTSVNDSNKGSQEGMSLSPVASETQVAEGRSLAYQALVDASSSHQSTKSTEHFSLRSCDSFPLIDGHDVQEDSRREEFSLERAICIQVSPNMTGIQIPEQLGELGAIGNAIDGRRTDDRVARAVAISSALEAALRANAAADADVPRANAYATTEIKSDPCASQSSNSECEAMQEPLSLTAAYFVSVDSMLRYWRKEPVDPVMALPRTMLWASREYVATYTRGDTAVTDEYVSQPYIDIAGAGIVQTVCRAVPDRSSPNRGSTASPARALYDGGDGSTPPKHARFSGIVCADLALRQGAVQKLVRYIQGGPLVYAGLVNISVKGDATVQREADDRHAGELERVTESAQWRDSFPAGWIDGPASRGTTRVQVDSDTWYVVPTARSGVNLNAIALHPTPSSGVGRLTRWLFLGSIFGAAFVLLTFTAHQSRRVSVASRDLARLRGLPLAVIESRIDQKAPDDYASQIVVAGNDRAEEVLQIRLPNFGLNVGANPTLGELVQVGKLIPTRLDNATPCEVLVDGKEILASRRRGDTNTYYARLKSERTVWRLPAKGKKPRPQKYWWVRMSAGPVILPRSGGASTDARGHLESTLGIIVPVMDDILSKRLDQIERLFSLHVVRPEGVYHDHAE